MEWATLVRFTVGVVFLASAGAKWRRPRQAIQAVRAFDVVPDRLARPAGAALLTIETALAVTLLGGLFADVALLAAAVLLATFAAVVAATVTRGSEIECGCLGDVVKLRASWVSVALNLVLAASAAVAALVGSDAPHDTGTLAALCACAVLLAATYWLALFAESVLRTVAQQVEGSRS